MKSISIIVAIVATGLIGWFLFQPDTVTYVATIDSEVSALETELAAIEVEIQNGTLTNQEAIAARTKIMTRLETISGASNSSTQAQLTPAQQAQLSAGLDRLKKVLIDYQSTLLNIDSQADVVITDENNSAPRLNPRGSNSSTLRLAVLGTIETMTAATTNYVPEADVEAQLDIIADEVEAIMSPDTILTEMEEELSIEEPTVEVSEEIEAEDETATDTTDIDLETTIDAELETETTI